MRDAGGGRKTKVVTFSSPAELEDIYLPYKPKRRTRAEIARERGLGPLAESILADRAAVPAELAAAYVTDDVADVKGALEGARDIVSEGFAENADLVGRLRTYMDAMPLRRRDHVPARQGLGHDRALLLNAPAAAPDIGPIIHAKLSSTAVGTAAGFRASFSAWAREQIQPTSYRFWCEIDPA